MFRQFVTTLIVVSYCAIAPTKGQSTPSPVTPIPAVPTSGATTPTVALTCNICGANNIVGAPDAIITFTDHAFAEQSMPCGDLQAQANSAASPYPQSFCSSLQNFALGVCECTTQNGTVLTSVPTMIPTPQQTTQNPSFPPGVIPLSPTQSPVVAKPTLAPGASCELCGSGNIIGSPNETFSFPDTSGNSKTLGCQQAQNLLDKASNVSSDWCGSVQAAAAEPCACTLPDGTPVQGGDNSPTVSPNNRDCWICGKTDGEANIMGDGNAVVEYVDFEGIVRKFPCKELARLAEDTIAIPLSYCAATIAQAIDPCRCATPEGDLLSDMYPTFSPVNGGKPATPVYQRDDDESGDGAPTNGAPSPSSSPNVDNGATGGGGSDASSIWRNLSTRSVTIAMATLLALGM